MCNMIPFSYSFFLHYSLVPSQPQVCHGTEKGIEAKEGGFQSTEVCSLQTCQAQYFQQQSQGESTTVVC
jgi:hypothetical protein